ncbi:hypothetical protein RND71_002550 [Anisodus tanguticus]|uniref:Uncharacterized protein n=1 Tax=Anisodus tanguticus TaxID=243964 RepID=A0AAE1T347_9SOLA|nr:hypothetical protein RND71_002550 [Anisodus tanguticus]
MWLSLFRTLEWFGQIPLEDDNTCYICIGLANKTLFIPCWVAHPSSVDFKLYLPRFDDYLRIPEDSMTKQGLIESHSWFDVVPATLLFSTIPIYKCLIGAAAKYQSTLTIANTLFYVLVGVIDGLNITSTVTEPTTDAISFGPPHEVNNIDFYDRVANHFELDFKSKQGNDFVSKPIILSRTWTTCVASIARCFEGVLEPYNLMKVVGYQPFDITFVSVISSCSALATFRQGQQIHFKDISTGAISVIAIISPLFTMYSISGCFNVRNFEETGEADTILCITMISAYGFFDIRSESVPLYGMLATTMVEFEASVSTPIVLGKCLIILSGSIDEHTLISNVYMLPIVVAAHKWGTYLCPRDVIL